MDSIMNRRESNSSGGGGGSVLSNSLANKKITPTAGVQSIARRRASMFDPIDPTELQKTLYQNQQLVIYSVFIYSANILICVKQNNHQI